MEIIDKLRDKIKENKITEPIEVKEELKNIIEEILTNENSTLNVEKSPTIILMVGVNGVGKTTTIGKLANRYKQEGKKVLYLAGSSKASGTYQSAMLAKNDIDSDDIHIFDTYSLCIGGGMLVIEAAKMVEEGLEIGTIINKLEEYKEKVQVYFSVDSLEHLYKGGRI